MKYIKSIAISTLITFVTLLFPTFVWAQREMRTTRTVILPKDETVTRDFFIKAGEVVEIMGNVKGDVVVAGEDVVVEGKVDGDLLAVGGRIWVTGEVTQDIRVAGGEVILSGKVGRNVTAFSGSIRIDEGAVVEGGVVAFAGDIFSSGDVRGDLWVAAGNLNLSGKVGGNIESYVGTISASSKADLGGDLIYTSDNEARIGKGASIAGSLLRKTPPAGFSSKQIQKDQIRQVFRRIGYAAKFIGMLGALVVGLLVVKLFPNSIKLIEPIIDKRLLASLGFGFIALIIIPIASIMLMFTVIGIPIAIITLMFYLLALYLSKIFVSLWLGGKLIKLFNKNNDYLKIIIGLCAYYILTIIPFVGDLIALIAIISGLGSQFILYRGWYDSAKLKKLT